MDRSKFIVYEVDIAEKKEKKRKNIRFTHSHSFFVVVVIFD